MPEPAITIAVPTFNRAAGLRRAVESALAQTETDLEILICDNHSEDDTQAVASALAAADKRVRVIRQERNVGLTENFNTLFLRARGPLVTLLADDDWLEPDYVSFCRAALDADPATALAAGSAVYHHSDGRTSPGVEVELLEEQPGRRVRRLYGLVADNVTLFGLVRRELLMRATPMRNCLAGDWLLVARLAFLGRVRTVEGARIHRSAQGTSADIQEMVTRMGLTDFEARHPHVAMLRFVYEDIAHDSPVYAKLSGPSRETLGLAAALALARSRRTELAIEELLTRPALAPVHRALRRRRRAGDAGGQAQ